MPRRTTMPCFSPSSRTSSRGQKASCSVRQTPSSPADLAAMTRASGETALQAEWAVVWQWRSISTQLGFGADAVHDLVEHLDAEADVLQGDALVVAVLAAHLAGAEEHGHEAVGGDAVAPA